MPNSPPKKQAKKSPQKKQGLLPPVSIAFPCRGGKGCCKLPDVMRPQKKPGRTQTPRLSDRAEGFFIYPGDSRDPEVSSGTDYRKGSQAGAMLQSQRKELCSLPCQSLPFFFWWEIIPVYFMYFKIFFYLFS